jgi:uncharacterized Ntn-hydrolase superfamily protein
MTFSIVAADADRGELGVGVQSKFLAVGAVVPWATGGIGAVATQAFADVTLGARGLAALTRGLDPEGAIAELLRDDPLREQRQVGIVAADGRAASYTGTECFDHASSRVGHGYAVQGNILAARAVVDGIADAYLGAAGASLAERLLAGLRAGIAAGGDRRGQQSAALLVVRPGGGYGGNNDRFLDLRVDDHPLPVDELARLLELHRLYFERSDPADRIPINDELRSEIAGRLARRPYTPPGTPFGDALFAYLGWENLEERWVDAEQIDPVVLDYIRSSGGTNGD